jgi:hypothetical protein
MNRFWRWLYWRLFGLRFARRLDDLLEERRMLHDECEELFEQIAENERAIRKLTEDTGVRICP